MKFVDTNIFLRYLTGDDAVKAEASYHLFQSVSRGEETLFATEAIVSEVVFVLTSRRGPYRLGHEEARDRLLPVLTLRNLRISQKGVYLRALNLFAESPSLDFEDALSVAHMERKGLTEIVSYDRDFDSVKGIQRIEP